MNWLVGDRVWGALSGTVQRLLGIDPQLLANLLHTLLAVIVWLGLRRLVLRALRGRVDDPSRRYSIGKTLGYVLGLLAGLVIAKIWLAGRVNLSTYLGIASAGLAIALQDPIINLAGWLYIMVRQPFEVGDRIQVGKHAGDVADIRLFTVTLLEIGNWIEHDQSTGRIIHMPNGRVFREPVANYTQGFEYIWHEVSVTVTFESDWERAHQILQDIAKEHCEKLDESVYRQVEESASRYNVVFKHLTPIVWTKVVNHGVTLTLRYFVHARRRRSSESAIWQAILRAFAPEPRIDFAYPTQRFYDMPKEGKHAVVSNLPALKAAPPLADDDDIAPKTEARPPTGKFPVLKES